MWVSFPRCAGNDTHHAIVVLLISVCFFSDFPLNLELFPPLGVRVRRQFAPDHPGAIVALFPRTPCGAIDQIRNSNVRRQATFSAPRGKR